jgi:hypothetical protein
VTETYADTLYALPFPTISKATDREETMDAPTFASFIDEERTRIKEAIKAAKVKRQEAEDEISQLEAQGAAITAYDAALKGKTPRAPRGPKGEKRGALLTLIAEHPDGMTRGEIIKAQHAHGDKSASQSISNSLAALKKDGRVTQEGKKYIVRPSQ